MFYLYIGAKATDITMDIAGVAMWSAVELNVAIVCASLMVMKPLVAHVFPRLFREDPAPTESHPFSNITPLTNSENCTDAQIRFPESTHTGSPPRSQGVSSRMDPSMEDVSYQRGSADHLHIQEGYLPK